MSDHPYLHHWSSPGSFAHFSTMTSCDMLFNALKHEQDLLQVEWPSIEAAVIQKMKVEWWFEAACIREELERAKPAYENTAIFPA